MYTPRKSTIDWQALVDGYNRIFDTSYSTEHDMLSDIGPNMSPRVLAKRLGVSYTTIYCRLDRHQIPRSHTQGGPNNKGKKEPAFLRIPENEMKELTIQQISSRIHAHKDYCYQLARKHSRSYRPSLRYR